MLHEFTHASPELLQNMDKNAGPGILVVTNILRYIQGSDQKYCNHFGDFEQLL